MSGLDFRRCPPNSGFSNVQFSVQEAINLRILHLGSCHREVSHQPQWPTHGGGGLAGQPKNGPIQQQYPKPCKTHPQPNGFTIKMIHIIFRMIWQVPCLRKHPHELVESARRSCLKFTTRWFLSHKLFIILFTFGCLHWQLWMQPCLHQFNIQKSS